MNANTYEGRLPTDTEMLADGGRPGVEYALVHGTSIGRAQKDGYEMIRGGTVITIIGPKGQADALVMARGRPIGGSDSKNGRRRWKLDSTILEVTGLEVSPVKVKGVDDAEAQAQEGQAPEGRKVVKRGRQKQSAEAGGGEERPAGAIPTEQGQPA